MREGKEGWKEEEVEEEGEGEEVELRRVERQEKEEGNAVIEEIRN
jgi:hypothetical protein